METRFLPDARLSIAQALLPRDGGEPALIFAAEDGETILITDFDVSQSFGHERGHSGRWVMHPVIRCSSLREVGEVAGTVTLAGGVELPATRRRPEGLPRIQGPPRCCSAEPRRSGASASRSHA